MTTVPLVINDQHIEYLSGPTNFCLLSPTAKWNKVIQGFTPLLLLIGDYHKHFDNTCQHIGKCKNQTEDSFKCVSTFTPFWYRLLDSIGSNDAVIDYYVESYFPKELVDSKFYFVDEKSKWLHNTDQSIMDYTTFYHPTCYGNEEQDNKDKCITENIRYNFSDLRLDKEYHKLFKEDVERLSKLSHSMINSCKKDKDTELDIDCVFYPNSESYLTYVITNCLPSEMERNPSEPFEFFFNTKGIKLLEMILDNPSKLIEYLCKNKDFKNHSMLWSVISLFDADVQDSIVELFKTYCAYCYQDLYIKNEDEIVESIENYVSDTDMMEHKYPKTDIHKNNAMQRLINIKKSKTLDKLATDIMLPFNDFYTLLHTSSRDKRAILTVYNAGNNHTRNLANFLLKKRYVTSLISSGDFDNKYLSESSPLTTKAIEKCKKTCQCLHFEANFENKTVEDFVDFVETFLTTYIKVIAFNRPEIPEIKTMLKSFLTKKELNKKRKAKLGKFYVMMLKGALINSKFVTKEETKELELLPMLTLKEYSTKKQLGN